MDTFNDKSLNCADCGQEFVFSKNEQAFYSERGFTNEPKRCKNCRDKRKTARDGNGGGGGSRQRQTCLLPRLLQPAPLHDPLLQLGVSFNSITSTNGGLRSAVLFSPRIQSRPP
jgi:hypothetical protein